MYCLNHSSLTTVNNC